MTQQTLVQILEANQFMQYDCYRLLPPIIGMNRYCREFDSQSHDHVDVWMNRGPMDLVKVGVVLNFKGSDRRSYQRTGTLARDGSRTIDQLEVELFTELMDIKVGNARLSTLCGVTL